MSESIELIEGDHILEPVEEAVAMYEDLLTDLRKFLVTISHSFVTLHLFQVYALFCGPPKCMMPFEHNFSASESRKPYQHCLDSVLQSNTTLHSDVDIIS